MPDDWHDLPWTLGKLLHGKNSSSKLNDLWNRSHRPYLNSVVSCGQWPQARLASNKRWELSDKCQLCLQVPGTLRHGHKCVKTMPVGGWPAAPADCDAFYGSLTGAARGVLTDRGMAIVRSRISPPFEHEHIVWDLWFDAHIDEAELTWYVDGSLLDGPREITARVGAGFAAVLKGRLVAFGHAVPPCWVCTIPAVEAWALCVILQNTVSRRAVVTDCLGNVRMLERGFAAAMHGRRPLARVWGSIFNSLEKDDNKEHWFDWMPAHTAKAAVGTATKISGRVVTAVDHRANFLVDGLAKKGAALHRVPEHTRLLFEQAESAIGYAATMVGVTSHAANNFNKEVTRADGTTVNTIARDSTPMTWDMRKQERVRAKTAAAENSERKRFEAEAVKAARTKKRADEEKIKAEDLLRRQELANLLTSSASTKLAAPHSSVDNEICWDWSLTAPVSSYTGRDEELEHLFEPMGTHAAAARRCPEGGAHSLPNSIEQWDWSLTTPQWHLWDGNDDTEHLFEPQGQESDGMEHLLETRSQPAEGLAAGSGSNYNVPGPVRGAAAPSPVGRHAHTLPAGIDNYKKTSKPRGSMEAQTPLSGVVLSAQQLNARKQNDRRAKVRAEAKLSNPVSQVCDKTRKVKAGASDVKGDTGRILDTVAAFWARKKAKANSETTD